MNLNLEKYGKVYGQIVKDIWDGTIDEDDFIADPKKYLEKYGIPINPDLKLRVKKGKTRMAIDHQKGRVILPLPEKPDDEVISSFNEKGGPSVATLCWPTA